MACEMIGAHRKYFYGAWQPFVTILVALKTIAKLRNESDSFKWSDADPDPHISMRKQFFCTAHGASRIPMIPGLLLWGAQTGF